MWAEPSGDVTASVAARVQSVLSTAEREATALQREVEATAQRRATELLVDAEREAERILREAEAAAEAYRKEARERLDAWVGERIGRLHATSERLRVAAEEIAERLDEAGEARRSLAALVDALGEAARETTQGGVEPVPPVPHAPVQPWAHRTASPPEPPPESEPGAGP